MLRAYPNLPGDLRQVDRFGYPTLEERDRPLEMNTVLVSFHGNPTTLDKPRIQIVYKRGKLVSRRVVSVGIGMSKLILEVLKQQALPRPEPDRKGLEKRCITKNTRHVSILTSVKQNRVIRDRFSRIIGMYLVNHSGGRKEERTTGDRVGCVAVLKTPTPAKEKMKLLRTMGMPPRMPADQRASAQTVYKDDVLNHQTGIRHDSREARTTRHVNSSYEISKFDMSDAHDSGYP